MVMWPNQYTVGIGITAHNRSEVFTETYQKIKQLAPPNSRIVVVDDASTKPIKEATFRFEQNVGIARAKNKCLELLDNCEHIFLFDDDTYPTQKNWYKAYIESSEPHLMYGFEKSLHHWASQKQLQGDLVTWDKPRGCMLYVENWVLDVVGGMSYAFGKHGQEHVNWSERIHQAGLTTYKFADVTNPAIYCLDQEDIKSASVKSSNWQYVNEHKIALYQEYRSEAIPVFIPRRADNNHRDRLYRFIKRWWGQQPNYRLVEGWHETGDFNRSAALNQANRLAGNWQVAVIADGDAYVDPQALQEAVNLSLKENKMVICLNRVLEVNQTTTEQILRGKRDMFKVEPTESDRIRIAEATTVSLMVVVTRNVWEQAGGFDEKFVGWGGEDNAFWKCCELTTGTPLRIWTTVYHLWHKSANKDNQVKNNHRWHAYEKLTNRKDMQWLQNS